MKKLVFLLIPMILFFLGTVIIGCQKEQVEPSLSAKATEITFDGVALKFSGNRLHLKHQDDLAALLEVFVGREENLISSLSNIKGFESMNQRFVKMIESADNIDLSSRDFNECAIVNQGEEVEPLLDHPLLKHLVNSKREIQIGDTVWLFERNHAWKIPYSEYKGEIEIGSNLPFQKAIIERYDLTKSQLSVGERDYTVDACDASYGSNPNPRKVKGALKGAYIEGLILYYAETKHLRKGLFGLWYAEKADKLEQIGCVSINFGNCLSINETKTNVSSIEKIFYGGFGQTCVTGPYMPNVASSHKAWDVGITGYCETHIPTEFCL